MNPVKRIHNFIRYRVMPAHNMLTHPAEIFYFEQYAKYILPYLEEGKTLLDIGCQHGRFTIPAIQAGMIVTATDIKPIYKKSIRLQTGNHSFEFRNETLAQSTEQLPASSFDVVLCIELLYNLPSPGENIRKLARLVKPGGALITSHRSVGYYIYRYIREKNFDAARKLLSGNHPDYNAQTKFQLEQMYYSAGLSVQSITPIGIFSGFGKDAFSGIANPAKMTDQQKNELQSFETDKQLQDKFGESGRYWLVCGMMNNEM